MNFKGPYWNDFNLSIFSNKSTKLSYSTSVWEVMSWINDSISELISGIVKKKTIVGKIS